MRLLDYYDDMSCVRSSLMAASISGLNPALTEWPTAKDSKCGLQSGRPMRRSEARSFGRMFPLFTTEAEEQMFSLVSKPTQVADDNLCRLVLTSLCNKLLEIDTKLENHGCTTSAVALDLNSGGGTDFDQTSFRLDKVSQVSLLEIFSAANG